MAEQLAETDANTGARVAEQKERLAGVFGRASATYDQVGPSFFGRWAERLLDQVSLSDGDHVLDVAAGRGAVLFRAAERVGPRGQVTGIDLASGMVDALSADIGRRAVRNATVRVMDAENLEFPDAAFDVVTCGFGIMFFPRPDQALAGFRRVLRAGGTVGLSYLPPDALKDSRFAWRSDLNKEFGIPAGPDPVNKSADDLAAAMRAAGFADLHIEEDHTELRFADPQEYWAWTWSHGMRSTYERMDAATLERYTQRAFAYLQAQHANGSLAQSVHAYFLTAQRPQ